MTRPQLFFSAILAILLVAPIAHAQELAVPESALRDEVMRALPDWWHLDSFEIVSVEEGTPAPEPSGKGPAIAPATAPAIEDAGGVKPGAPAATDQVAHFTAMLQLTEQIYEPLYTLDGTAFVRPIMNAGFEINVSGSVGISGEGSAATFTLVSFDQGGLMELGRPREGYDLPTVIAGSEEAEAFIASRDAARSEGTMNKLMGDTGEEL